MGRASRLALVLAGATAALVGFSLLFLKPIIVARTASLLWWATKTAFKAIWSLLGPIVHALG